MATTIKGKANQIAGHIDNNDRNIRDTEHYIGGHSILFNGYDRLPEEKIKEIGGLLFDPSASKNAKKTVLIILAHYPKRCALNILRKYNNSPYKELTYFAETALWEYKLWNK